MASWRAVPSGGDPSCGFTGSAYSCDGEFEKRWFWNEGNGVLFAMRVWLFNRLSFQIQYGTQYRREEDSFSEEPLVFLPSLHF